MFIIHSFLLQVVHECCISVQVKSETIKQHEESAGKFHKGSNRVVFYSCQANI